MTGSPRILRFAAVLLFSMLFAVCATASSSESEPGSCHWSYSPGPDGPDNWWQICPQFTACGKGSRQSPVNIIPSTAISRPLPALITHYGTRRARVVNTGHDITVEITQNASTSLQVGGRSYELAQFHFHTPAEHEIAGRQERMEIHFVHADQGGELAVIGVMVEAGGAPNPVITAILNALNTGQPDIQINPETLLPAPTLRTYFGYAGSLTTPPCTEGVRWHLLDRTIRISDPQIQAFEALFQNARRPLQDLNGRVVLKK